MWSPHSSSSGSAYVHDVLLNDAVAAVIHKFLLRQKRVAESKRRLKKTNIFHINSVSEDVGELLKVGTHPSADYTLGRHVRRLAHAEYRASSQESLDIFQLGEDTEEDRRESAPPEFIPLQTQSELTLLWRTLSMFESMDDCDMLLEFYSDFLKIIVNLEPLALSAKWHRLYHEAADSVAGQETASAGPQPRAADALPPPCVVGLPPAPPKKRPGAKDSPRGNDATMQGVPVLPHSDLLYLRPREADENDYDYADEGKISAAHDPLGVVHRFFSSAECLAESLPPNQRSIPLSVCLALAIKSGRASLLFKVIYMLMSDENRMLQVEFDLKWLDDIVHAKKPADFSLGGKHCASVIENKATDVISSGKFESYESKILSSYHDSETEGGYLMSFGKADHGKLGHGDAQHHRYIPTVVEPFKSLRICKVSSMSTYSVAIDQEGTPYIWGTGGSATIPHGHRTQDILPSVLETLPVGIPVLDVSCGLGHALFLVEGPRVFAWGNGGNGRLGLGSVSDRSEAEPIVELDGHDVVSVSCGASHSMARTKSGRLYTWGKNSQGQCGRGGNGEDVLKPVVITSVKEEFCDVVAGWDHSLGLTTSGCVYAWGSGYKDSRRGGIPPVLGLGHNDARPVPEKIASLSDHKIVAISSGWDHCLALSDVGKVFSWGSGQNGKLGHGNDVNIPAPTLIQSLADVSDTDGTKIVTISAGCEHSACIDSNGVMYTWGHGDGGRLGHGDNISVNVPKAITTFDEMSSRPTSVHCGDKFTFVIATDLTENGVADCKEGLSSVLFTTSLLDQANRSLHADVFSDILQQCSSSGLNPESLEVGERSHELIRAYDVGHMLLSRLNTAATEAISEALTAPAGKDATVSDHSADSSDEINEREQAYVVELDVTTFQYAGVLLNMFCDQCSQHMQTSLSSSKAAINSHDEREYASIIFLVKLLQENLTQLRVRAKRKCENDQMKNRQEDSSKLGSLSLASRLNNATHTPDKKRSRRRPREYSHIGSKDCADDGGSDSDGVEGSSFLELCEQLQREANDHVPLRSCSDTDSSADGHDEREALAASRPRFLNSEQATIAAGNIAASSETLAQTQHQHRQLNSSIEVDELFSSVNSLSSSGKLTAENKQEFDNVLSELLNEENIQGNTPGHENIVLPTNDLSVDDTDSGVDEARARPGNGPIYMARPIDDVALDGGDNSLTAQVSMDPISRSMVTHRLERESHGPGGIGGGGLLSRNATPNSSQRRRGSHPTGISDTVEEVTEPSAEDIAGDDFERVRTISVGSTRMGATSPAMSQESWERGLSNEPDDTGDDFKNDDADSDANDKDTMYMSNSFHDNRDSLTPVEDDDTSSVEIQKALLMSICSDSDASPDRFSWRKSLGSNTSPGRRSLTDMNSHDVSILRMMISNIRGSLQFLASRTFEQLKETRSSSESFSLSSPTYRRIAQLWSRVNEVFRCGINTLYTYHDTCQLFMGLMRDPEPLLPIVHGICSGLSQDHLFSKLARKVLRSLAADYVSVIRNGSGSVTAPARGSSKMKSIPTSRSGIFSSPNLNSSSESVSFLDFKKAFHFVHNYFVLQDNEFFGSSVHVDGNNYFNPMKTTANANFSFLRMCLHFIMEVLEPSITSKVYLKTVGEGKERVDVSADISLLLGGRLLFETLSLVSDIAASDVAKVTDMCASGSIDTATNYREHDWRFTAVFIPFLADYYTQCDSLEVAVVYLPHALTQLQVFLKHLQQLPENSLSFSWLASQCRWLLLYCAKISSKLQSEYLLRKVPAFNAMFQNCAELWNVKQFMSWKSRWFGTISSTDQHKVMLSSWLLPQVLLDAGFKILDSSFPPTDTVGTVRDGVDRSDSLHVSETAVPSSFVLSSLAYRLMETTSDSGSDATLGDIAPSADALYAATQMDEVLWRKCSSGDNSLLSRLCVSRIFDTPAAADDSDFTDFVNNFLNSTFSLKGSGVVRDSSNLFSHLWPCRLHVTGDNNGDCFGSKSQLFTLLHMLILSLVVENNRLNLHNDDSLTGWGEEINQLILKSISVDKSSSSSNVVDTPVPAKTAYLLSSCYFLTRLAVASAVDGLLFSSIPVQNFDAVFSRMYAQAVSLLDNVEAMNSLATVLQHDELTAEIWSLDSTEQIAAALRRATLVMHRRTRWQLAEGPYLWDSLRLDSHINIKFRGYDEQPSQLFDSERTLAHIGMLLATGVPVTEVQDYLGWCCVAKESSRLSFNIVTTIIDRLQVAPQLLNYFVSAIQTLPEDSRFAQFPNFPEILPLAPIPISDVKVQLDLSRRAMRRVMMASTEDSEQTKMLQAIDHHIFSKISVLAKIFSESYDVTMDEAKNGTVNSDDGINRFQAFEKLTGEFVEHIVGLCVFYSQFSISVLQRDGSVRDKNSHYRRFVPLQCIVETMHQLNVVLDRTRSSAVDFLVGPVLSHRLCDRVCENITMLLKNVSCFERLSLMISMEQRCLVAKFTISLLQKLTHICKTFERSRRIAIICDQRRDYAALHPSVKSINVTNPVMYHSVHSPTGSFMLQFWLFIPSTFIQSIIEKHHDRSKENPNSIIFVHLLSRLPEASNVNQLSLFEKKDLHKTTCLPTVYLCVRPYDRSIFLSVCASSGPVKKPKSGVSATNTLPPATAFAEIESRDIQSEKWVKCAVHLKGDDACPVSSTGMDNSSSIDRECYHLELYIDGEVHGIVSGLFRGQSLHHNVLFGTVPTSWTDASISDGSNNLLVSDLSFASQYRNIVENEAAVDVASSSYLPVSYLSQKLSQYSNCLVECSAIVSCFLERTEGNSGNDILMTLCTDGSFKIELLLLCIEVLVLGNEIAQDHAFRLIINLFSAQSIKAEGGSSEFKIILKYVVHLMHLAGIAIGVASVSPLIGDCLRNDASDCTATFRTSNLPHSDGDIVKELDYLIKVWDFRVSASKSKYVSWWGLMGKHQSALQANQIDYSDVYAESSENIGCSNLLSINENAILLRVSSVLSKCVQSGIFTLKQLALESNIPYQLVKFYAFICGGGWIPSVCYNSIVDMNPRALFLKSALCTERAVFPCVTTVHSFTGGSGYNTGRPIVLLNGCAEIIDTEKLSMDDEKSELIRSTNFSVVLEPVPSTGKSLIPATELVSVRDPFDFLTASEIVEVFNEAEFPTVKQLSIQLRCAVARVTAAPESERFGYLIAAPNSTERQDNSINYVPLAASMAQIRCVLLQMVQLDSKSKETNEFDILSSILSKNFSTILELAAVDYVSGVLSVLDTLKLKPGQLDILKNLLREEDISFLEKIVLRLFPALRYMRGTVGVSKESDGKSAAEKSSCTVLAGEAQISDNKIRALNHFPSIRVLAMNLRKGTGRWFYECTLLTDGLMQIGWADRAFRCDPVCGQGVGDHPQSWAFDGFRTKKWNVSCENYGTRWRVGDIVGVLIDMDLLEMSFYLNGCDLGVAFSGFHCDSIYPALSMNVRQIIRVNYGQYKFAYPPSVVDHTKYRSILEATIAPTSAVVSPEKKKVYKKPSSSKDAVGEDKGLESKALEEKKRNSTESLGDEVTMSPSSLLHLLLNDGGADTDMSELVDVKGESKNVSVELDYKASDASESVHCTDERTNSRVRVNNYEDLAGDNDPDAKDVESRAAETIARGDSDIDSNDSDDSDDVDQEDDEEEDEDMDDDDDDDDDDAMDEEGGHRRNRHLSDRHRDEELNPELELRRQALIENLIGMGFPVDWALRAAEHCDASVSESAAISWIIERMELEQAKLDEFEGSDSRMIDEGEYESGGNGYEHLQRATRGAEAAAEHRMNSINRSGAGNTGRSGSGANGTTVVQNGSVSSAGVSCGATGQNIASSVNSGVGVNGHEAHGSSVATTNGDSSDLQNRNNDTLSSIFLLKDEDGETKTYMPIDENIGNGSGSWNEETQYPSVTPGSHSSRQRLDNDKQDILLQVSDLNIDDLYPIIMASQFSLCVLYARLIVVRMLKYATTGKSLVSHPIGVDRDDADVFMKMIASSESKLFLSIFLPACFKIGLSSTEQSELLLPNLLLGVPDRQPFLSPFVDKHIVQLVQYFSDYKNSLGLQRFQDFTVAAATIPSVIGSNLPSRLNHFAIRETSIPKIRTLSRFLKKLYSCSCDSLSVIRDSCRDILNSLISDAVVDLEKANQSQYYRCDWISGEGYDKIGGQAAEEAELGNSSGSLSSFYSKPKVFVLWSYFVLTTVLKEDLLNNSSKSGMSDITGSLRSPEFLQRLVKMCLCPNIALRYCLLDICLLVMTSLLSVPSSGRDRISHSLIASIGNTIAESSIPNLLSSRIKFELLNRKIYSKYAIQSFIFLLQWRKLVRCYSDSSKLEPERLLSDPRKESDCVKKMQYMHSNDASQRQMSWLVLCDHLSGLTVYSSSTAWKNCTKSSVHSGVGKAVVKSVFHVNHLSSTSITVSWNLSDEIANMRVVPGNGIISNQTTVSAAVNAIRHTGNDVKLAVVLSIHPVICEEWVDNGEHGIDKWIHQTTDVTGSYCIDGLAPDTRYAVSLTMRWSMSSSPIGNVSGSTAPSPVSPLHLSGSGLLPGSLASRLMRSPGNSISNPSSSAPFSLENASPVKHDCEPMSSSVNGLEHKLNEESLNIASTDVDGALQPTAFTLNNSRNTRSSQAVEQDVQLNDSSTAGDGNISSAATEGSSDITQENTTIPTITCMTLVASTETEPLFLLDNATLPASLILGQNALTVRNKTNKKWSTVRASVQLSNGIHRWGVHIDRCISKNIFIGVVTEDARSDNYVGCDRYGWAFLANKAVWHNKVKIRSYGELFVTGDMIVVTLNLDLGTMSFALNGKDLGIAMEGLSGSFYPAFSLYNEDDQVTLIPMKAVNLPVGVSHAAPSDSSAKSNFDNLTKTLGPANEAKYDLPLTSSNIENLLDRFEVVEKMLLFMNPSAEAVAEKQQFSVCSLGLEIESELFVRWMRWLQRGGTRSICSTDGQFVTISVSDSEIYNFFPPFSDIFFSAGETVKWGNNYAIVLGVGSHRLWFQSLESGNVSGLTRETLSQLQARNVIRPVELSREYLAEKISRLEDPAASPPATYYSTLPIFRENLESQLSEWTPDLDNRLLKWLEVTARKLGVHVCNLPCQSIVSPASAVEKAAARRFSCVMQSFHDTFSPLCDLDTHKLRLRAHVLLSVNDIILPLLPLLAPPENVQKSEWSTWFWGSGISRVLSMSKHVLFKQVKNEFACRQGGDFQPSLRNVELASPENTLCNNTSGLGGVKQQSFGESSSNFCSTNFQLSRTPYVLPTSGYFSAFPDIRHPRSSGAGIAAYPQRNMMQEDSEAGVRNSTRLDSSMQELQLQYYGQQHQLFSPTGVDVPNGATSSQVLVNTTKAPKSPRGSGSNGKVGGVRGANNAMMTIEIEDSGSYLRSILEKAIFAESELCLLHDKRWALLFGYQASLLGQLFRLFETISDTDTSRVKSSAGGELSPRIGSANDGSARNDLLWQANLKKYYRPGPVWEDFLCPRDRRVPISVRPALRKRSTNTLGGSSSSRDVETFLPSMDQMSYFQWLMNLQKSGSRRTGPIKGNSVAPPVTISGVSDFVVFEAYLRAATQQILALVKSSGKGDDTKLDPGEINIMLHCMHALGVSIGLSLRYGVSLGPDLSLSECYWRSFVTESLANATDDSCNSEKMIISDDFNAALIRHGITTVVPEVSLSYWTWSELRSVICGQVVSTSTTFLRQNSVLSSVCGRPGTLESNNCMIHIELFWLAFAELNEVNKVKFLKYLWVEQDLPEEVFHYDSDNWDLSTATNKEVEAVLPGPIFIGLLEVTQGQSASLESVSSIRVSHETCTVLIPPFRSLSEALRELVIFIKELY